MPRHPLLSRAALPPHAMPSPRLRRLRSTAALLGALLAGTAQAAPTTWTGATNSVWDTGTANWTGGTGSLYTSGDNVVFNDTATASWSITGGAVTPGSVTFNNTAATTYSVANAIGGAATTLTKNGNGTVNLTGINSYAGGTAINAGTLAYQFSSRAGWNHASFNSAVLGNMSIAGTLELNDVDNVIENTYIQSSTFTGGGTINKTGVGQVEFNGGATNLSAFTGQINVQAGTLGNNGATWGGQMGLTISSGAFLDIRTGTVSVDALSGGGTVTASFNSGNTLSIGNNGGGGTFSGVIQNGSSAGLKVIKNGAGTEVLSGKNTYTGGNTINGGTLKMDLASRTDTTNYIGLGTTAITGTLELSNTNATIDNATGVIGYNATSATTFTGAGTINKTGAGYIDFFSSTNLSGFSGTIDVQAGTLASNSANWGTGQMNLNVASGAIFDNRTGTVTVNQLTGSGTLTASFNSGNSFVVGAQGGSSTFDGAIQGGGTFKLTKTGAGTLTLTGANTYTGGLVVNQGVLTSTGAAVIGNGSGVNTATVQIASGATLNLSGTGNNQLEAYGTWTIGGTLAATTNAANSIRTTSIILNNGTMTSSGGNGGQAATYGAFFSYRNTVITANGATNTISGNGDFGIKTGTTLTLNTTLVGDALTVSTSLKNVGGAGALTKTGLGTVILSGNNSYTGTTTVTTGTLLVNGTHNAGAGAYSVGAGGKLGGNGTITTSGAMTLTGQITGGDFGTVDTLRIAGAGSRTLSGIYLFDVDYSGMSGDLISITGATSLNLAGSTFAINELNAGSMPAAGSHYAIKIFESNVANGGAAPTFTLSSQGLARGQSVVTWDGGKTYYLVPEPASFALLGLGCLLLLRRPSRRCGRETAA